MNEILKHPLLLLFLGAIISRILIPYFTAGSNKDRLMRQATMEKQLQIVQDASQADRHINALLTRLEMFHKDNVRLVPKLPQIREMQAKLQEDMNTMYLAFDRHAWWWYRTLYQEAQILELPVVDNPSRLDSTIGEYQANLIKSTQTLETFWHRCISNEYDIDQGGKTTEIQKATRTKIDSLGDLRRNVVTKMITFFHYR